MTKMHVLILQFKYLHLSAKKFYQPKILTNCKFDATDFVGFNMFLLISETLQTNLQDDSKFYEKT